MRTVPLAAGAGKAARAKELATAERERRGAECEQDALWRTCTSRV